MSYRVVVKAQRNWDMDVIELDYTFSSFEAAEREATTRAATPIGDGIYVSDWLPDSYASIFAPEVAGAKIRNIVTIKESDESQS